MSDPAFPTGPSFGDASTRSSSGTGLPVGNAREADGFSGKIEAGAVLGGRFRILAEVGRGGMGVVYRARDERLGEEVAIKAIRADLAPSEAGKERFLGEVRLARRLAHPSIVRVFELGEENGLLFVAMELLDGVDLARTIEGRGALGVAEAVRIVAQACEGLEAAHREGIVHRDIKPRNVFLCSDGRVKILDFGLARALGAGDPTRSGRLLGTPAYMAPEQILPERYGPAGPRSDVYSMGIVLYEALTGRHPFPGEDPFEIALKRLAAAPIPPRRVNGRIPRGLQKAVLWALAKEPAARPQSPAALAQAIAPWAGEGAPRSASLARLGAIAGAGALLVLGLRLSLPPAIENLLRAEASAAIARGNLSRGAGIALQCLPQESRSDAWFGALRGSVLSRAEGLLRSGRALEAIETWKLLGALGGDAEEGLTRAREARGRELEARLEAVRPAAEPALQAPSPPTTGRIVLSAARPTVVYLDGKPIGRTPFDGEVGLGLHRLKLVDETTGRETEEIVTVTAERPIERDGVP